MSPWVRRLDRRFYPDVPSNWDDELFRRRVLEHLDPDAEVLDLGAGAGIVGQMDFRGCAKRVCGVDLDPRVLDNEFLDEGRVATANSIPYADECFDVVVSNNVLEHLDEPETVFSEVARVLKPGGLFLFKTPNKTHYMPLIARVTPHGFHAWVNKMRGRKVVDTFPTRYRANSRRDIHRLARRAGLEVQCLERIEGRPEYMRLSVLLYPFGILYERIVNFSERLAPFRILLIGCLIK